MNSISTFQGNSVNWALEKAQEWHQQREIGDPDDESEAGIQNDADTDDVGVDEFLKACSPADGEEHDQMSKDLHLCAQHLGNAKVHQMCSNHEEAIKSLNKAMTHFQRFHSALKAATKED
jgi:hydroxypyruvate isomerase